MNKAVVAGRADGLFVEALGVELPAFEASDLGADQCGAVLEILRAVLRPDLRAACDARASASRCCGRSPAGAESHAAARASAP